MDLQRTGTLPRIAIVFLVCGFLFLKTRWRTQALIGGAVLILYWLVMTLIPTPGYGKVMGASIHISNYPPDCVLRPLLFEN